MRKKIKPSMEGLKTLVEHPLFCLSFYEFTLSDEVFRALRSACTKSLKLARTSSERDVGSRLAGQIREGIQLDILPELDPKTISFFEMAASKIVGHYRAAEPRLVRFKLADIWLVLQKQGDYNPPHAHGGDFSGVCYLQVPRQIGPNKRTKRSGTPSGNSNDGALVVLGNSAIPPNGDARFSRTITPQPRKLYMFPSWTVHSVNPFYGKGDRLSVAFNLEKI